MSMKKISFILGNLFNQNDDDDDDDNYEGIE